MKTLCLDLVFLLIIGPAWTLDPSCPQLGTSSQCQCTNSNKGITVECNSISDSESLFKEIQNFRGYHIDDLKLIEVQLPYLPAGLFTGTAIKRFHIVSSQLDNLYSVNNSKPSPFQGLENSLEEIHVKHTKSLSKWYWPDLKDFKQMKKFQIEHSPISFIGHVFAEIGGGSLEVITARYSRVYRIHPQGFTEMTNLREANFDSNYLPYLVRTMFPNPAPRLERLNFRDNKVFILNENMFENMPSLKYLDFSQNEFTSFQDVPFTPIWDSLQFLRISGNPFQCECNLLSLKEKVLTGSVPAENDFEDVNCLYKGNFKKTKLIDVSRNDPKECLW